MVTEPESLRIAGVIKESIVDGPGIRFVIFCQGCIHDCAECHNPETHDFKGGSDCSYQKIMDALTADKLVHGVTYSGGEPFCQAEALSGLSDRILEAGYDIWTYSGYTFEELYEKSKRDVHIKALLEKCSVLIDGPFQIENKSLNLMFRGSTNQRILDLKKSMEAGSAVELKM